MFVFCGDLQGDTFLSLSSMPLMVSMSSLMAR